MKFSENKNLENRVASTAYYLHLFVLLNLFFNKDMGIKFVYMYNCFILEECFYRRNCKLGNIQQ